MSSVAPGIYTATVRTNFDPKMRFRYGVQVHMVHDPATKDEDCTMAEVVSAVRGSYSPLQIGEQVLVMFVDNDRSCPVIIGFRNRGDSAPGLPSTPLAYQVGQSSYQSDPDEFNRSLQRIQHMDDNGNMIELSMVAGENRACIKSGGAEIYVTLEGHKAVISASGAVEITSSQKVTVNAGIADITASTVNLTSDGTNTLHQDAGKTRVTSNHQVVIGGFSQIMPSGSDSARVDVGGEIKQIQGIPLVPQQAAQTASTSIMSGNVNIGASPTTALSGFLEATSPGLQSQTLAKMALNDVTPPDPRTPWLIPGGAEIRLGDTVPTPIPMQPTMNINIMCAAKLTIEGGQIDLTAHSLSANIYAPDVKVTAYNNIGLFAFKDITINAQGSLSIYGLLKGISLTSAYEVSIAAPKISLGLGA